VPTALGRLRAARLAVPAQVSSLVTYRGGIAAGHVDPACERQPAQDRERAPPCRRPVPEDQPLERLGGLTVVDVPGDETATNVGGQDRARVRVAAGGAPPRAPVEDQLTPRTRCTAVRRDRAAPESSRGPGK